MAGISPKNLPDSICALPLNSVLPNKLKKTAKSKALKNFNDQLSMRILSVFMILSTILCVLSIIDFHKFGGLSQRIDLDTAVLMSVVVNCSIVIYKKIEKITTK